MKYHVSVFEWSVLGYLLPYHLYAVLFANAVSFHNIFDMSVAHTFNSVTVLRGNPCWQN